MGNSNTPKNRIVTNNFLSTIKQIKGFISNPLLEICDNLNDSSIPSLLELIAFGIYPFKQANQRKLVETLDGLTKKITEV